MKKVLLDENLPVKLKYRLQDVCDFFTVNDKGWNTLENGELINAMQADGFDFLLTSDKNLQYQQNLEKYSMGFIILNVRDNNYETILPLVPEIKKENIIGIEAPLWSETVSNLKEAEYLIYPRLPGYAEIGWTPVELRNWDNYKVRLASHGERMKAMDISFYPSKLVPWENKDKK